MAESLFQRGYFKLASGQTAGWKIECDSLTDEDWETIAEMIRERITPYGHVEGMPRGGLKLASILNRWAVPGQGLLLVDDVYTTGGSIERSRGDREARGVVVFARNPITQDWIEALFTLSL
jgi:hypothetical protein